jgi:hypothetical protein
MTEARMKLESWIRYLVAAALVLMVGAVWALAGDTTMKVEVKSEGGKEMTIDVNGVTEVITLEDLADGEERSYDVGGHEVTVKRIGERLALVHDGESMGHVCGDHHKKVWVETHGDTGRHGQKVIVMKSGDGETVDIDVSTNAMFIGDGAHGEHDVFVFKNEDGEFDIEALKEKYGDDFHEFHTEDGAHVMKWVSEEGGGHPFIVKRIGHHGGGDSVTYRCEETGSMLTVKADENLLDDYIDPVTGCLMKKVENAGVHVIKIREEIVIEDEDE